MAEKKAYNPQSKFGKCLAKLISRTERLVEESKAIYQDMKELKNIYFPKEKGE